MFRFAYNGAVGRSEPRVVSRTAELVERVPRTRVRSALACSIPALTSFRTVESATPSSVFTSVSSRHLGCELRVGRETRATEGKCLAFDDSFEHEVWSRASTTRYIFMLDIHHPELTDTEIEWIAKMFQMFARGSREADGTRWNNRWQPSAQTNP